MGPAILQRAQEAAGALTPLHTSKISLHSYHPFSQLSSSLRETNRPNILCMCIYACVQRDTYIDICAHTQTHFFYKRLQVSIPNASKKKKNQTTRCIEKKSKDGLPFLYPTSFVHLDSILVIL